jgi:oxaloacetate decarboxylase alpha subunit
VARIEYIDQTCRDGQQALWGMHMRAGHILPVAREIDDAGYRVVDITGSTHMEICLRFHKDNPWTALDALRAAMPKSTFRCGKRSNGLVGMGVASDAIIELYIKTLASHGIGSMWIYDCLHDVGKMRETAQIAQRNGIAPSLQLNFSESPVHTDEYYVKVLSQIVEEPSLVSVILGDEAGVLGVERARSWIPLMKEHAGDIPLEMHFHDNTGVSALNHITGVEAGITILHTAVRHMSNGVSLPSTQVSVDNMRRLGHEVAIDGSNLDLVSEHFKAVAEMEGYTIGAPVEFNLATVQSQIPGGMMGTLRDQLAREGLLDRLPELLEEAILVRSEMGWPIMATPYSQLIGIQALMNVVTGKRYSVIPDENLMYLAGWYGEPPAPIADFVLERAWATERGRKVRDGEPPQPTIAEIRAEYGERLSDEELLLRYLLNETYVDAMYAANQPIEPIVPIRNIAWVQDLMRSASGRSISATLGGTHVALKR